MKSVKGCLSVQNAHAAAGTVLDEKGTKFFEFKVSTAGASYLTPRAQYMGCFEDCCTVPARVTGSTTEIWRPNANEHGKRSSPFFCLASAGRTYLFYAPSEEGEFAFACLLICHH